MCKLYQRIFLCLILFWAASAWAGNSQVLEVFVREGCPHCTVAKRYLGELVQQRPGLVISMREVDRDEGAAQALMEVSRAAGHWPPGVPTFVYQGRVLVGFGEPAESGAALLALIDGEVRSDTEPVAGPAARLSAERLGLPLFTLVLGLLDGFNPCAMWVLLFLLSLLVHLRDRQRMALVAGCFVLVSGLMYYAFMAAWLNVFLLVGWSNGLRLSLALLALLVGGLNLKDFLAPGAGPSLVIPQGAKPGLYARMRRVMSAENLPAALLAVSILAVAVNFIELLCTAGLPALYTAVLAQQQLPAAAHYAYLGLYILAYVADDALMVALAVMALSSDKLGARGGRWLKLLSGLVMAGLGLVMLFRPAWLW